MPCRSERGPGGKYNPNVHSNMYKRSSYTYKCRQIKPNRLPQIWMLEACLCLYFTRSWKEAEVLMMRVDLQILKGKNDELID